MKKILIMGGSYFIGKKIANVLKEKDYDITLLNRGTKKAMPSVNLIKCDRNNEFEMKEALRNKEFDIIIDVCGLTAEQSEILLKTVNTSKLEKIIFISSSSVYNVECILPPYKETDTLGYNKYWRDYGQNKIEAEEVYSNFAKQNSISLVILRPPYVYGEDNYAQRESFIFEHIENEKPIIVPFNNFKLQFIYSGDLALIVNHFIIINELPNVSIYNVGNTCVLTVTEWIAECCNAMQKDAKILYYDYIDCGRNIREFFPFHDYDNYLDVTEINQFCLCETTMHDGLKNAYDWYRKEKHNIQFKENIRLNEIEILKEKKNLNESVIKYS